VYTAGHVRETGWMSVYLWW